VHEYVAAVRHTLPGFSPRLAFGCRSGAAGLKIIVQNFNASYFRLSLRRGRTENHCPKLQRVLLSVVAPARPDRKSLPETSTHPCFRLSLRRGRTENHCPKLQRALAFGCPSGAPGQIIITRNFNAPLLRCMDLSRLPVIRCPVSHLALLSVVPPARPGWKSLPETLPRPARIS